MNENKHMHTLSILRPKGGQGYMRDTDTRIPSGTYRDKRMIILYNETNKL